MLKEHCGDLVAADGGSFACRVREDVDDLAIIDRFTETFSRYIDSGFGLLAGDVAFLTSVLVAIDITLAGLFWPL